MVAILYPLLALLSLALVVTSNPPITANEALHKRSIFYVGGQYVFNTTLGGNIVTNDEYVEELTPAQGVKQKYPIVFFHGGGPSGAMWLNKPDGGRGWASYFLDQGYRVYLLDLWGVGRSSGNNLPSISNGGTVELVEVAFSAPQLSHNYYQAQFHTQFPGNGSKGDPSFDAFYARFIPLSFDPTQFETIAPTSTCALLAQIGPAYLIDHSLGAYTAFLTQDKCPQYVKAHVSLEGDNTPFASYDAGVFGTNTSFPARPWGIADVPLTYSPRVTNPNQLITQTTGKLQYTNGLLSKFPCIEQVAPAKQLVNIAKAPLLILTSQASIHATYDQCLVQFLQQARVGVKWTKLADVGIAGNGHFMFLEKNSDVIAEYVDGWLRGIP